MATLKDIAYNILNLISGGKSENTPIINVRQIENIVRYYRSLLVRRALERSNRLVDFEQTLSAVLFEVVPQSIARRFGGTIRDTPVLRTVNQIPVPMRLKNFIGITYVGDIDHAVNFDLVSNHSISFQAVYNRFTNYSPRSTYLDGYIWIANPPKELLLDKGDFLVKDDMDSADASDIHILEGKRYILTIRGIFDDPEAAAIFDNQTVPLDPFPAPGDIVQQITQSILNGEMRTLLNVRNDVTLDNLPVIKERQVEA